MGGGEYDGLLAIAEVTFDGGVWTWRGCIIEGDLSPTPEAPAAIL